jgi:Domain of unknown function DUF1828
VVNLKKAICEAFCSQVEVSEFAGGYAVGTPYFAKDGDRVGMYVMGTNGGPYRIMDNALTVSFLESAGATLENAHRREIFVNLLSEYSAQYNEEDGELYIEQVSESVLPKAVLNFTALLLRVNDLSWLSSEKVRSTFKEDVKNALSARIGQSVKMTENEPVTEALKDITPDLSFYPLNREPIALFLVANDARLWEAIHLKMVATHEQKSPLSVVAILEKENSVTTKVRIQADNRLDAIPRYGDEKKAAIDRVVREIVGNNVVIN